MKIEYKTIGVRFLALVGAVTLCLAVTVTGFWLTKAPDESAGITAPLEKSWATERYFGQINNQPLIKSEMVQVVRVKVLSESPKSVTLEILYDSKSDAPLDDVWISAAILKDSGLLPMYYTKPAKASAGHGRTAVVRLGIADQASFEILASNAITINFYKGGGSPFHEAKYEYQRIWCRKITEMNDLWKRPYPAEKGSRYSINGTRTVSRLCLGGGEP